MAVNGGRRARYAERRKVRMGRVEHDLTDAQWTALQDAWAGCAYCVTKGGERARVRSQHARRGTTLDALVHNAGAMPPERTDSPQGHELSMSLHVLGPVPLTELLLPAFTGRDARVVLVTSGGMYAHKLPVDDPGYERGDYAGATAYARSKRTQVGLLPHLTTRWAGDDVAVYAMHPGWAETLGVTDSLPTFDKVLAPILRDADAGADTTPWLLASAPRPRGGGLWMDRRERPTAFLGRHRPSPDERRRMWDWVASALDLTP